MNRRLGTGLCILTLAALCPRAVTQDHRQQPASAAREAYAELIRKLTRAKEPPAIKERIRLLRAFLDRHAPRSVTDTPKPVTDPELHTLVLKVRLRLGRLLLVSFDCSRAIVELRQVTAQAQKPEHRDLRGRSLYGTAQAQEMLGQVQACRTTLRRLQQEFEDTRYGRIATIAAQRLVEPAGRARNGAPAPAFGPLLDLRGRSISHASLRLQPALLMFWSPDVPASMESVERLAGAWQDAGGDPQRVVAFAVYPDPARVAAAVKQRKWSMSIVPCGSDFLDPVVLAYRVDGLPTTFLLGPDGMLLGRDQGALEIAKLLSRLR
ncbi:MAG: TlpA family protein disulfide reductase [Planctomycetota bacterium]|jgi:hypothetical protein